MLLEPWLVPLGEEAVKKIVFLEGQGQPSHT